MMNQVSKHQKSQYACSLEFQSTRFYMKHICFRQRASRIRRCPIIDMCPYIVEPGAHLRAAAGYFGSSSGRQSQPWDSDSYVRHSRPRQRRQLLQRPPALAMPVFLQQPLISTTVCQAIPSPAAEVNAATATVQHRWAWMVAFEA